MSFAGSDANNAIDRNITTCSRTNDIGGTSVYKTVWWKVDLGGVYSIYSISILFKKYDAYDFGKNVCFTVSIIFYYTNCSAK